jgi:hypothetical protein
MVGFAALNPPHDVYGLDSFSAKRYDRPNRSIALEEIACVTSVNLFDCAARNARS